MEITITPTKDEVKDFYTKDVHIAYNDTKDISFKNLIDALVTTYPGILVDK